MWFNLYGILLRTKFNTVIIKRTSHCNLCRPASHFPFRVVTFQMGYGDNLIYLRKYESGIILRAKFSELFMFGQFSANYFLVFLLESFIFRFEVNYFSTNLDHSFFYFKMKTSWGRMNENTDLFRCFSIERERERGEMTCNLLLSKNKHIKEEVFCDQRAAPCWRWIKLGSAQDKK